MELIAYFDRPPADFVTCCQLHNLPARPLKKGDVVLKIANISQVQDKKIHINIPALVLPFSPLIKLQTAEEGGKGHRQGSKQSEALVICTSKGRPFKPYFVTKDPLPLKDHAFFSARDVILTVKASQDGEHVEIRKYRLEYFQRDSYAVVTSRLLWQGNPETLSDEFRQYKDAVNAAVMKCNCLDCTHAHFIQT
jgi:hypothetical protein